MNRFVWFFFFPLLSRKALASKGKKKSFIQRCLVRFFKNELEIYFCLQRAKNARRKQKSNFIFVLKTCPS